MGATIGIDGDVLYGCSPRGYHRTRTADSGLHDRWTLRSDRPSWHPDDCDGACCWNRTETDPA